MVEKSRSAARVLTPLFPAPAHLDIIPENPCLYVGIVSSVVWERWRGGIQPEQAAGCLA